MCDTKVTDGVRLSYGESIATESRDVLVIAIWVED